ncbi:MAG: FprA family A-type flavoprotein [Nanoarchaeota archaeon]|nr:FprA family A-type flavoprotein [Nanoarchaeota archaeon]MBU1974782.1 FprA family A-type flavoprotein [Nanoarchaeota archaeon]
MKANKIKDDVFWLGVNSPSSREFHGISTPRGGSYNSYLVLDEKPTIIEGTGKPFIQEYLKSLKSKINPEKIEYIIIDHAEPDHAGAINEIKEVCSNAKIVCTEKCKDFLIAAFGVQSEFVIVKEGDELNIGKRTFKFFPDPMVHWPETMMSYLVEEKMLFSADLFGTEISHEKLFADEMKPFQEITRDYFAIVMRHYAIPVQKAIEKARTLEIEYILSSHGPIYRQNVQSIMDYYYKLATEPEENKVAIFYYSIWHSSEKMADEIAKGVEEAGSVAVKYDINQSNFVRMMAEAMTSKAIALGSLTLFAGHHPLFNAFFDFLQLNNQPGKKAGVFGTYGWVSEAVPKLKQKLMDLKYDMIGDVDMRFGPKTDKDLLRLRELGKKLAE